jgi:hypothetical protein
MLFLMQGQRRLDQVCVAAHADQAQRLRIGHHRQALYAMYRHAGRHHPAGFSRLATGSDRPVCGPVTQPQLLPYSCKKYLVEFL